MINFLHSVFHRPEKGWDPIPAKHANCYAEAVWDKIDYNLISRIENWIDGFQGKRVLDLGGGPGQYSVAFAKRGAMVTWHDISRNYQKIAQERAARVGVEIAFSLGYMEEAIRFKDNPFDLIFCNLCWCYCRNDYAFSKLLFSLVKPGGAGYIDNNTPEFDENIKGIRKTIYFLNNRLGWKIGHPYSPRGRIVKLLNKLPIEYMIVDYTSIMNDKVFFIKSKSI